MYISAASLILMISAFMVIVCPEAFFKILWFFIRLSLGVIGLVIAPLMAISAYFHYNKNLDMTTAKIGFVCLAISLYSWNKLIKFFKQEDTQ